MTLNNGNTLDIMNKNNNTPYKDYDIRANSTMAINNN